jgi:hypothetical protein
VIKLYFQDFQGNPDRIHRSPLLQSTSSTVSASVSRSLSVLNFLQSFIVLQTHTHRFLNNFKSHKVRLSGEMTLYLILCKKNSCSCLSNHDPRDTLGNMEWSNLPMSAASYFPSHFLSKTNFAKHWKFSGGNDLSKTASFDDDWCLPTHYLLVLRETRSTLVLLWTRNIHSTRLQHYHLCNLFGSMKHHVQKYQNGAFFAFIW